ncbi:PPK2 family polyphosphate kinase [Loigolactobacillus backii]|uniref:Phosphate--nucleotide phosphotransferase n=1 Tax=Loigolactobacillus backii TaxID=375175 RepID=A0A192H4K4_9LACO|nr:PPK2 family polyphosphate kinase [Loigolactobacillus backii]ANK59777.1 phosphate--nucleotide phosphotransferase [Loigolactobacillus backii]ANK63178.1 phosphate--nucleotide phosphotransferase [Loigolactobacillus backii]ANK64772.1 phosphate--nucleotide phosphotransferase [Loigolactobacillus backii]ANK66779.1 phosphate--nucleotide phosphotransferase [Loigolactobacillus backii]ANK69816.1 phosphate--nucleotide phosphotransferase [Loigolactobacillus backii]
MTEKTSEQLYRYTGKKIINLTKIKTAVPIPNNEKEIKASIQANIKQLNQLEDQLYAQNRYGVVIIFQALDAAGKDSMIRHVLSGVNPQGCSVVNFKQPSSKELAHDFLWRIHQALPERGHIGVFNRSYYEDVLAPQVHPELLLNEHLPKINRLADIQPEFFSTRYTDLNQFETYLNHCGYQVLKFFLHISKDEQKKRFERRIEIPEKTWKFSTSDIHERAYWDTYQRVYSDVITATASRQNPWYIIPADNKWQSRKIVSNIINARLSALPLAYPKTSANQKQALTKVLNELEQNKI